MITILRLAKPVLLLHRCVTYNLSSLIMHMQNVLCTKRLEKRLHFINIRLVYSLPYKIWGGKDYNWSFHCHSNTMSLPNPIFHRMCDEHVASWISSNQLKLFLSLGKQFIIQWVAAVLGLDAKTTHWGHITPE